MFIKFIKEKEAGLVEYLILLCVMAVAAAMIFPSARELNVRVFNQAVNNINSSITGEYSTQPSEMDLSELPIITPPGTPIYTRVVNLDQSTPRDDYQVKVTLTNSNFDYTKAKSDGSDLIFKDMSGIKLNRYIESWNVGGTSTIWVKVKTTGTNKFTINYDKVQSQANDPQRVFELYDDFSSFNTGFWKMKNATNEYVYAQNGVLNVKQGGVTTLNQLPFDPKAGYSIEVKAKVTYDNGGYSGSLASIGTKEFLSSSNYDKDATVLLMRPTNIAEQNLGVWVGDGDVTKVERYAYLSNLNMSFNNASWYTFSYSVLPNRVDFFINGILSDSPTVSWKQDLNYLFLGDFRGITYPDVNVRTDEMQYDYISVRKASSVEPNATVGTETVSNN